MEDKYVLSSEEADVLRTYVETDGRSLRGCSDEAGISELAMSKAIAQLVCARGTISVVRAYFNQVKKKKVGK